MIADLALLWLALLASRTTLCALACVALLPPVPRATRRVYCEHVW